jgi:hypothetical protein
VSTPLAALFSQLEEAWCPVISVQLFSVVKVRYKPHVVDVIKSTLEENMEAAVKLGNFLLTQLQTTIVRQRKDYEPSSKFAISDITEAEMKHAPVNTMKMEHSCGKVTKNKSIECTSIHISIQGTAALKEK